MMYRQGLLGALEIVNSWAKTAEDMGHTREESILHDVRVMIEDKIAEHDISSMFNKSEIRDFSSLNKENINEAL